MKKLNFTLKTTVLCSFILTFTALAHAQQRTFVSGTGNDANACTAVTAPCRTFQRGHNAVAAGGEVVALNSAEYGSLNITKPVTISGEGIRAAITSVGAGNGVTINAAGATVILRELTITGNNGTGTNGVQVTAAANVYIERCAIGDFSSDGIGYNTNGRLFITDTVVRDCDDEGLDVNAAGGTARVNIDHSLFEGMNSDGIDFNGGTIEAAVTNTISSDNGEDGFEVGGTTRLQVERCTAANNGADGFNAESGSVEINIEYSVARGNTDSGIENNGGTIRVSNSVATNNDIGFNNVSGTLESRVNNTVAGNTNPDVGVTTFAAL